MGLYLVSLVYLYEVFFSPFLYFSLPNLIRSLLYLFRCEPFFLIILSRHITKPTLSNFNRYFFGLLFYKGFRGFLCLIHLFEMYQTKLILLVVCTSLSEISFGLFPFGKFLWISG